MATDALEAIIARCWSEVLSIERPQVDHDFFELGGDSLQGLELTDKLAELLPFEVPLVALFFQDPTIGGLARAIAAEVDADQLALLSERASPA